MNHYEGQLYEVTDEGDVVPSYTGEVNGPRNSEGALIEEVDHFLDGEEVGDEEEISELTERALDMATKAGAASLEDIVQEPSLDAVASASELDVTGVDVVSETLEERLQRLQDERDADRAGTHPGSSQSDFYSPTKPSKKLTSDEQNRNYERHKRRWGR